MRAVQDFLYLAAAHLPVWRDLGVMLLAAIVIGLVYYAAT